MHPLSGHGNAYGNGNANGNFGVRWIVGTRSTVWTTTLVVSSRIRLVTGRLSQVATFVWIDLMANQDLTFMKLRSDVPLVIGTVVTIDGHQLSAEDLRHSGFHMSARLVFK